ncbi:hypothetical protein ASPZODRAFT_108745 [Penicilliopsis zonata CBS 506.65]|uniref:Isoleucine--tRNA ligase, mitochondrial n=1 Tax=Penicilliopsis zonata CBS 506.65 TaxID=1073090 RepID=A0A1L9SX91_9EURO|nr:hypothetical protein ASPZODRAFT_108745 [Penicilliopsis zonata CBS 506.65]OJJ51757.1 hypothetical protein ASPZODRAFT_108745 [Penicilliopsis zonata CBS 506.65]
MATTKASTQAQIFPGKGLALGASLHNVLSRLKSHPQLYPAIDIAYSSGEPLQKPVLLQLPANGLRLRFDGPDQRLRLIEVLDFTKINLVYKNQEVIKGAKSQDQPVSQQGPSFRHVYNRLFGPSYPGEYVSPASPSPYGTYVLSYPGIAFSFPLQDSAWSDQCDFVALLSSSAALPATSMAIFQGSSWPEVRAKVFTQQPQYPRSPALAGKNRDSLPDEVERFKIFGAGKLEAIRRSSSSTYITLSETTPQDLIAEFGPPDAIYRKNDRRISIHRATGGRTDPLHMSPSPGRGIEISDTEHSSNNSIADDSDEELAQGNPLDPSSLPTECFFNYFHHGFDAFISSPTTPGPAFPGSGLSDPSPPPPPPSSQLTVTKIILHGNVPGSYPFNRHRRSRWTIYADHLGEDLLTSETPYEDISKRLRSIWQNSYSSVDEERALQRPMVLNRGWGDSPESSVEFLGGWEESTGGKQRAGADGQDGGQGLGNTELFGFPGLLFEVMKNGALSSSTFPSTQLNQFIIGLCDSGSMPELPRSLTRSWSSTLKLPKSTFPPRASPADQAKYLQRCTDELYAWQRRERPADRPFVFHDGPPYANGDLHVGHALNKILKDIICRVNLGLGKRVQYIPGWDCHGLPIELKALQGQKDLSSISGPAGAAVIRKAARKLASKTVVEQMKGFRSFAVMADWENHYKTMNKDFEMRQLGVFREMVEKGLIYRRFKPVYWSPSTGTALAEAELEYKDDHVSTAAVVKFPLVTVPPSLAESSRVSVDRLSAVIWTTTPWTLPANAAIAVNESLDYVVVESQAHGQLIVAESRIGYLQGILNEELPIVHACIPGSELALHTTYRPLFKAPEAESQPVIAAEFVTAESGSGLVHCAPGHGMDDYEVCLARGIPAFAPVNDQGQFTEKAMPSDPALLCGKHVLGEGNSAVLEYVKSQDRLLHTHKYEHKYPHDWRSKQPIIIRATEQWFADVADIRGSAMEALEHVHFVPEAGKQRLQNFVKNRSEWCISRQRAWGVPIPALYHRGTGEAVLTKESVSHIMRVIEERGIDAWWTDDANDQAWIHPSLQESSGAGYRRGTDTMDVWFDSGSSWSLLEMLANRPPADVYLEGSDQHRGWFQSSLLTFIAHQLSSSENSNTPRAPFKNLITHGFTLDENGYKMSKSIGNVMYPQAIMDGTLLPPLQQKKRKGKKQVENQQPVYDALGPDALRMWVASSDYTRDVVIGTKVLQTVNISLHKYRVTFKLLLGALSDFSLDHIVPYEQLQKVDHIALMQLSQLVLNCQTAYENFEFYKAVSAVNRWTNMEFSAFYIEAIKDRLYTYAEDSTSRRAAQTTLFYIYRHLQEILAPVTPMLIEESWEHTPDLIKSQTEHPLKRIVSAPASEWNNPALETDSQDLLAVGSAIKTAQENARSKKQMGSSLQSFVHLVFPVQSPALTRVQDYLTELPDIYVVSSVTVGTATDPLPSDLSDTVWQYSAEFECADGSKGTAHVYAPHDSKCPRCWRYVVPEPQSGEETLCGRCEDVVREIDASASA